MKLPRREREILDLLCQGKTSKEIAAKLELATSTVDHRVAGLLLKARVSNRLGLVVWALGHSADGIDSKSQSDEAA